MNRMFATANKSGIYQDKSVYGQGLLDLEAATAPVGTVSALMSHSLSGPMTPAIFTGIQLTSPSFGDAITNGLSNKSVIFFDQLDAPFRQPLSGLVSDYRDQIINLDGLDEMQNFVKNLGIFAGLLVLSASHNINQWKFFNNSGETTK